MRCNARRIRRSGRGWERERWAPGERGARERREGKGKGRLRELGEILQGKIENCLILDRPRRDLPIATNWATRSPPFLHSYSSFRQSHRDLLPLLPSRQFPPPLPPSPSALPTALCCSSVPPTLFPPIVPLVSIHGPYLHEAVPPRCFNLYLFHFSALFFSAFPIRGEAFISPLIHLYARR